MNNYGRKIKEIKDNLKDNGRVLVRASGTEPIIRVMIEGENQSNIEKQAQELADLIKIKLN